MKAKKAFLFAIVLVSLAIAVSCNQPTSDDTSDDTSGSLDLASLSVEPGTLSPAFDKDTLTYTVSVANTIDSLTVTATTVDEYAGLGKSPANPVELDVGETEIWITVSEDTTDIKNAKTQRYIITVTRAAP